MFILLRGFHKDVDSTGVCDVFQLFYLIHTGGDNNRKQLKNHCIYSIFIIILTKILLLLLLYRYYFKIIVYFEIILTESLQFFCVYCPMSKATLYWMKLFYVLT